MNKSILTVTFLIGFYVSCFTQDDLTKKIQVLEKQIISLIKQDSLFKKNINIEDSIEFVLTRNSIINAIDEAPRLVFNFDKIIEDIEKDEVWTQIVNANNPSSDILGVSFVDVVTKSVEKHFLEALEKNPKLRFADIVNKIVKNPIISSVLNSNPVTSVVASITNAASSFFTSNLTGKKVQDLAIDTKNVFDQQRLDDFNKELAPYINFYDEMILANENYNYGLAKLKSKYKFLSEDISGYNSELMFTLGINLQSGVPKSTQANDNFKINLDSYGFKNYKEVLNKSKIKDTKLIADKLIVYQFQVKDFQDEYNDLLESYLKTNINLLNSAKEITLTKGFDPQKIDKLIITINAYLMKKSMKIEINNNTKNNIDNNIFKTQNLSGIYKFDAFNN